MLFLVGMENGIASVLDINDGVVEKISCQELSNLIASLSIKVSGYGSNTYKVLDINDISTEYNKRLASNVYQKLSRVQFQSDTQLFHSVVELMEYENKSVCYEYKNIIDTLSALKFFMSMCKVKYSLIDNENGILIFSHIDFDIYKLDNQYFIKRR